MLENVSPKVVHKLMAAEGYLELGMPIQALEALSTVDEAGPLEAMRLFLIGESYLRQERYHEAIEPLHQAARMFPVMESGKAWNSLSECFRQGGYHELAEVALLTAEAVEEIEATCEVLRAPRESFPRWEWMEQSSRMTGFVGADWRDLPRIAR